MATKIKIERYERPDSLDGWAGHVEPEDRSWILFFREGGQARYYPDRDPFTGAVIEPGAQKAPFILYRHADPTGVSGTGLVAYGWEREDGRAVVRWLGEHRTETLHEGGMASVRAIHGHGGRTQILVGDIDPERLLVPAALLGVDGHGADGVWLGRDPDHPRGMVFSMFTEPAAWAQHASGDGWAEGRAVPIDQLASGDLIEGVVVDGEQHLFHEVTGGTLIGRSPLSSGNAVETWVSEPNNPRRERIFRWDEIVELLAMQPSHLVVTRLLGSCGGDPAYVRIPIRRTKTRPAIGKSGASA